MRADHHEDDGRGRHCAVDGVDEIRAGFDGFDIAEDLLRLECLLEIFDEVPGETCAVFATVADEDASHARPLMDDADRESNVRAQPSECTARLEPLPSEPTPHLGQVGPAQKANCEQLRPTIGARLRPANNWGQAQARIRSAVHRQSEASLRGKLGQHAADAALILAQTQRASQRDVRLEDISELDVDLVTSNLACAAAPNLARLVMQLVAPHALPLLLYAPVAAVVELPIAGKIRETR